MQDFSEEEMDNVIQERIDASIDGDLTIDDITPEMRAECERFGIDPDFMVGEINMFEFS